MPHPLKVDARLKELKTQVELLEVALPSDVAKVNGEDETWNRWRERTIAKICQAILGVKVTDEPTKAVAIISRLHTECEQLLAPQAHIDQHRMLKKNLDRTIFEHRKRENLIDEARREADNQPWRQRNVG